MILSIDKTQVTIVGAGLSGLLMATQLLRYGIRPVIIDKRNESIRTSEYLQISARSMEILQQLGVDVSKLETLEIEGMTFQKRRIVLENLEYKKAEHCRFMPFQIVKQAHLEQALIQTLTRNACPIYWNVNLTNWKTHRQNYRLTLKVDRQLHEIQTDWVIGADGINGTVRQLMQLEDVSEDRDIHFTTQITLKESVNRNVHFFLCSKGYLQLIPLSGKGSYRITAKIPGPYINQSETKINRYVADIMGFGLPVQEPMTWTMESNRASIMSNKKSGRALLVGGITQRSSELLFGKSINAVIQDTHNLAWKLSYVLKEKVPASILHSYTEERMSMEQRQARTHHRFVILLNVSKGGLGFLRDKLIKKIILWIKRRPATFNQIMNILGQTETNYRNSSLSIHLSAGKQLRAGDRLPDLPLYHEKEKAMTNLHEWCAKPGFILLILGDVSQNQLFIVAQWIQQKYAHYIHLFYLPFSQRNQSIFDTFKIIKERRKMILVRPDMYIACLHDDLNTGLVDTYMTEVLQWRA